MVFLDKGFKFHPNAFERYHYLLEMSMNLSNIAILTFKGNDYHCIINGIRKNEAIDLMQNTGLTEKSKQL